MTKTGQSINRYYRFNHLVILMVVLLLISTKSPAQRLIGVVLDSLTQEQLSYVNIGVVGKGLGTVSDDKGNFELFIGKAADSDTLRFSIVGYSSRHFLITDIRKLSVQTSIRLLERPTVLRELTITSKTIEPKVLGIQQKACYPIPLYRGASSSIGLVSNDLGTEIGTHFPLKNQIVKLDSVLINFKECIYDSIFFRLNIYTVSGKKIESVLKKPLYFSMSKNSVLKLTPLDLTMLDIFLDRSFIISIENVKNVGGLGLLFYANFKAKAKSYPAVYRKNSQSEWKPLEHKSKPVGISILAFTH